MLGATLIIGTGSKLVGTETKWEKDIHQSTNYKDGHVVVEVCARYSGSREDETWSSNVLSSEVMVAAMATTLPTLELEVMS